MMPHDLPKWKTVYDYFRTWRVEGVWERLNGSLRRLLRLKVGRDAEPSAGVLDSQSVKTTEAGGIMPAVDSPEPDGVSFGTLQKVLETLLASDRCIGMDVTIFDPDLDASGVLAERVVGCLGEAVAAEPTSSL